MVPAARRALLPAALAAFVFACSLGHGFLKWDDDTLILGNPVVRMPPLEAAREAFERPRGTVYWPLRDLSYAVDHAIWGMDPFGFHLTNLLLYAAVAGGLYLAARPFFGGQASFLGAMLFAAHPLHAEAAAWASGRKDLLCAVLLMGAWIAVHLPEGTTQAGRLFRFGIALMAYLAACLAKSAALPFPLAWWALDAILGMRPRWGLLERLPFLAVMLLLGAGQGWVAVGTGAAGFYSGTEKHLVGLRMAVAAPVGALVDQFGAMLWPLGLCPAYPVDHRPWGAARWLSWALALGSAALLVRALRRSGPAMPDAFRRALAGLAWAGLCLLPVINLGLATSTVRADRYAFLPSAGFCLALGALLSGRTAWRAMLLGAILAVLALKQGGIWRSDHALWGWTLRRQPASFLAAGGLAHAEAAAGRPGQAGRWLDRMVRVDPDSPLAHHQLGGLHRAMGDLPRALLEYGEAVRLYAAVPKGRRGVRVPAGWRREHAQALLELAGIVHAFGQSGAAAGHAEHAAKIDPAERRAPVMAVIYRAYAAVALPLGDPGTAEALDRAASECRRLLAGGGDPATAAPMLAVALAKRSQLEPDAARAQALRDEAERIYRSLPALSEPDRRNLGALLALKAEALAETDLPRAYLAAVEACALFGDEAGCRELVARLERALKRPETP